MLITMKANMINWQIRYSKILSNEPSLFDPKYSVLEVGSGDNGAAMFLNRDVQGIQPAFGVNLHPNLKPQIGTVDAMPYEDQSFDFTICMDVLEHLSSQTREKAIKEIVRVTRRNAWIAFPFGVHSQLMESSFHDSFNRFNLKSPDWLLEHLENSLPKLEEILAVLRDLPCNLEILVNEYMGEHFAGLMADLFMPRYKEIFSLRVLKTGKMNPIVEDKFDFPYSILLKLSKYTQPDVPVANSTITRPKEPERKLNLYPISHIFSDQYDSIIPRALTPLYVGDAAKAARRGGLESDLLESEARLDNARWCELTGIYKVWKSAYKFSHVGFCHYRRLFNFSAYFELTGTPAEKCGFERSVNIRAEDLSKLGHTLSPGLNILGDTETIIVPPPASLPTRIFEQYTIAHSANDYFKMLSIIFNDHPSYRGVLAKSVTDNFMYSNNMFILSIKLFDELCEFWFDVLKKFEAAQPEPVASNEMQSRDIAFLSERVFDIWIKKKIAEGVKTSYVPIYNIQFEKVKTNEWSPTKFVAN